MNIKITGRHMEMTDAIKQHVEKSLEKLRAHFDRVMEADVVLTVEKPHRHIADVTLHANGVRIHAEEVSPDMYTSVDAVAGKLDKQLRKFKERVKKARTRKLAEVASDTQPALDALEAGDADGAAESPENQRPIVREAFEMKPMSVEEAALQFELTGDPFMVFRNADTEHVNVLYPREDGSLGLIEPQF